MNGLKRLALGFHITVVGMYLNSGLSQQHFVDAPSDARLGNLLMLAGIAVSCFGLRRPD